MAKIIKIDELVVVVANEDHSIEKIERNHFPEEIKVGDEFHIYKVDGEYIIEKVKVSVK